MKLLIFLVIVCQTLAERCLPESCSGQFQLTRSKPSYLNITGETHTALSVRVKTELKATIIVFSRYWNYEYEGGSADGNSGSKPVYDYPELTLNRALDWKRAETCEYGSLCVPGGDCWGSDADYCLQPKRDILKHRTKKGENKYQEHYGESYNVFARHSCVLDWECQLKTFDFPLHIDILTLKGATSLENGTQIVFEGGSQLLPLGRGTYLLIDDQDYTDAVLSSQVKVKCLYPEDIRKAVCIVQSGENKGNVLSYSHTKENGWEFFCNSYMCVNFHRDRDADTIQTAPIDDKAASLRDIYNLQSYIQAELDRNTLNLAGILNHTQSIEAILVRMLKRLSQTDPLLLSWVLEENGSYMTRYMNHDTFTRCACYPKSPVNTQICNADIDKSYIFKNGEFTLWNKVESCFSLNPNSTVVKNLTVIDSISIMKDIISMPSYVGASLQWQGWQWLNKYENDLLWTVRTTKAENVAGILGALDSPFFHPFNMLFSMISGYVSWIALVLSIINCIRR